MTTPVDIIKMRELHAATRPGEWTVEDSALDYPRFGVYAPGTGELEGCRIVISSDGEKGNMEFIAAAKNQMPALLDELEALRAGMKALALEVTGTSGPGTVVTVVPDTSRPAYFMLGDDGQPVVQVQPMQMASFGPALVPGVVAPRFTTQEPDPVVCIVCGGKKPDDRRFFCSDTCIDKFSAEESEHEPTKQ